MPGRRHYEGEVVAVAGDAWMVIIRMITNVCLSDLCFFGKDPGNLPEISSQEEILQLITVKIPGLAFQFSTIGKDQSSRLECGLSRKPK